MTVIGRRCSGCWTGFQTQQVGADGRSSYGDCDVCGLPGPKPQDYVWQGRRISHYVNHGNTWQAYSPDDRPAS